MRNHIKRKKINVQKAKGLPKRGEGEGEKGGGRG